MCTNLQVTQRNKYILEENKDTIFIPVQFMLPALRLCKNFKAVSRLNFLFKKYLFFKVNLRGANRSAQSSSDNNSQTQ